jgi:glycosyltransferase involved in cell wall biosynthesis
LNPLRIAFCVPTLTLASGVTLGNPTDATSILLDAVAVHLCRRGHQLTTLTTCGLDQVAYSRDLLEVSSAPRSWSLSIWFRAASSGAWRIQQALGVPYLNVFSNYRAGDAYGQCLPGHDIVYERNSLFRSGVARASRRLGLPYILFVDADELLEHDTLGIGLTGLLRWRAKDLFRFNLRTADRVLCVSDATRDRLVNIWNVAPEKVVVFPNGVDVDRFTPDLESAASVRRTLQTEGGPSIVFVGGFYPWHDVNTLLAAFALVVTDVPSARLVLVGDGAARPAAGRRVTELGLQDRVIFTGAVPHAEVPAMLAAADVAVAPYGGTSGDFWLSPLKVLEYMAAGTAVVTTRLGQLAQVVSNGVNGLLVPPGDPVALATALGRLLGDDAFRAALGRRAREDAVQRHSWAFYASRLEGLCREVINERAGARRPAVSAGPLA